MDRNRIDLLFPLFSLSPIPIFNEPLSCHCVPHQELNKQKEMLYAIELVR